jgi:hypothetical protein
MTGDNSTRFADSQDQGSHTIRLVNRLFKQGIQKMSVLVRHGDRHYDLANVQNEPFLPLTEHGKQRSYEFGLQLPSEPYYHFFSSPVIRCVETAYQIEKGCIKRGDRTQVNIIIPNLAPFFVKDCSAVFSRCAVDGPEVFIQSWLRGHISEEIMLPPKLAIREQLVQIMVGLVEQDNLRLNICVTHDVNLYLIRELCLGQLIEDVGRIDPLEGLVFFEQDGVVQVSNHLGPPKTVRL